MKYLLINIDHSECVYILENILAYPSEIYVVKTTDMPSVGSKASPHFTFNL
jgi:hypothetical protein